ncbi:MAG: hypothetical protein FWD84_06350, partial [Oscillospiraceae bacterium]|nr:hypothetical protein [Oscillospiraceae bacterium]
MREFSIYKKLISLISCFFAGFYLYTSGFGIISTGTNLSFYLLFTAVLVVMIKPMRKGKKNKWWMDIIDVAIIIALATSILYWLFQMPVYVNTRLALPNTMDY